jgi:hypothetical protein
MQQANKRRTLVSDNPTQTFSARHLLALTQTASKRMASMCDHTRKSKKKKIRKRNIEKRK